MASRRIQLADLPRKSQPQFAAQINTANKLSDGLVGAFYPASGAATSIANADIKTSQEGVGFSANSTAQSWIASPSTLVSLSPTWTILAIVVGSLSQQGIGGMAFFAERPNSIQIVKLGFGGPNATQANLTVRNANGILIQLQHPTPLGNYDGLINGRRVLIGTRRASNDHRVFVNGSVAISATDIPFAFVGTNSTIANDLQDTTSFTASASVPLVLLWNRSLADTEIAAINDNPWQVLK